MNLIFRLLKVLLMAWFRPKLQPLETATLRLRAWPTDLDVNLHLTNSRYLAMMDLGRMDLIARGGYLSRMLRHRWQPLVGACAIRYRRPIDPFQAFELKTRLLCWDDKWLYMEQRFEVGGQLAAVAYVKGLFRGPTGNIPPRELFAGLGHGTLISPEPPDAVVAWQQMEADLSDALAAERVAA